MASRCDIRDLLFPLSLFVLFLLYQPLLAHTIHVLLNEKPAHLRCNWVLKSEGGFVCYDAQNQNRHQSFSSSTLTVCCEADNLICNGRRCRAEQLVIVSSSGSVFFNGHLYGGSVLITREGKHWHLINVLDLEEYLYSVVRWESWPGWPMEVNKVLAIASRSYAVSKMARAYKRKRLYHVRPTNKHQTYKGIQNNTAIQQAVDATRGLILTYDNKPVEAMFDSCCGGIIPAHMQGLQFQHAPYLARSYPCTFCKDCRLYSWSHELSVLEMQKIVQAELPHIGQLSALKVTKRDKAGIARELLATGRRGSGSLTGKRFYSLMGAIKSFCFSIVQKGTQFVISGRGYGHHAGLCQWGARALVDRGWNYRAILQFYYPATTIQQLRSKEMSCQATRVT